MEAMLRSSRASRSPESLFDSALLFEEASLPEQAEEQWTLATKTESSPEWRAEDLARQSELSSALKQRGDKISMFSTDKISMFSTSLDALLSHPEDAGVGSELALNAAIEKWLPQMGDAAVLLALKKLSGLLISFHHDHWLADVLKPAPSGNAKAAFTYLAQAQGSNIRGEYLRAAKLAQKAERLFKESRNEAGALRARVETIYSLDRRSEAQGCLSDLEGVQAAARKHGYLWIAAQARLEDNSCQTRTRQEDVIEPRKQAYEWIKDHTGYEGLRLRALGYQTEEYVSADSRLSLWRNGEQGLRSFWSEPLPALRGYAFYYALADSAHRAGDKNTAVVLLREGALLIKKQDAIALHALMLSYLGLWEQEAGLPEEAEASFHEMEEEYGNLSPAGIETPRRESEVVHAIAEISSKKAQEGLARLHRLTGRSPWPYRELIANARRLVFPALGDAYLQLNQLGDACHNYHQSLVENWEKLNQVHNRAQRDNALHEIEPAWRGMTAVLLKQNRFREALTVWEEFRSSRKVTDVQELLHIPACAANAMPSPSPLAGEETFIVYASLPGGLFGWVVNRNGTGQHWIDEKEVDSLAARFTELVATEHSPVESLSQTGQQLYDLLLKPFAGKLPGTGTIVIDAEGALASIPWGALESSAGHPLIERFAFCQTIGLAEVLEGKGDSKIDLSRALVFGSPALPQELRKQFPNLPDAWREVDKLRALPGSRVLQGEAATAEAFREAFRKDQPKYTVFHFAGHGVSYGGFGALLLAGIREKDSYFTAHEIATVGLQGLQLIVLASCSSGVGEQSGIVDLDSLTRAFLEAGAQRVIASSWEVDSSATADLIRAFYNRLENGTTAAESLRQAQMEVQQTMKHPYYWAGFRVFGRP